MARETGGGISHLLSVPGPEGKGDKDKEGKYHGHGLMQIDDRSFPEFCASEDWKDPEKNILFAARVLARKMWYLDKNLGDRQLPISYAISAYNCGEGKVKRAVEEGRDPDSLTTHGNYALTVLEYAGFYRTLEKEEKKDVL